MPNPRLIDGFTPLRVVRPASVAELGALVRDAAQGGTAIYPVGGGTMLDYGLPPTKPGTAVELTALDGVIDYPARDMTITVGAGITVDRLAEILRAEGQQLPVDVPLPGRATLGGAVATNASGPRRLGHGTLRDYVIGISVMNDEGHEIRAGGRVVKNVAGYDLMKLYTGSLGTLGVITQLTLKVKPRSEASQWVVIPCDPDAVPDVLGALSATRTRPSVLTVRGQARDGRTAGTSVIVGFEDNARAVEWQVSRLNAELPAAFRERVQLPIGPEADALLAGLCDFPLAGEGGLTFKANLLPARTWAFCRQAADSGPLAFMAHAGSGIVFGHLAATDAETARKHLEDLGRFAGEYAGSVVVTRCPMAWKAVLPVWGRSTPDRVLMTAVKARLDPRGVFNPGRFVNGI